MPETRRANAASPAATSGARSDTTASPNNAYVLSGMVRNESVIVGQGAIFDLDVGNGRVIAFSFNPLHRFLNHHEFPLVWNALMTWNLRPDTATAAAATDGGN